MKNRILNCLLVTGLVFVGTFNRAASQGKAADKRPNIVIILADDMGFSDPGCYGGEIQTPNINWLAQHGIRFTEFYNTSRCCPTRASLLTGLYNQQAGIGNMTTDQHEPGYRGHLTDNAVTLAEVLKSAGYQTAMSGKWHVSNTPVQSTREAQLKWLDHQAYHPSFSPVEQYPINKGFDRYFGTIWGVVDYFDPFSLVDGTTPIRSVPEHYYHTDAINDTAAKFIQQMSKVDKPFFLYVAENAPHWPLMAKPEVIAKYENTYKSGWEAIREARYARMVQMGIIDPKKAPLSPRWHDDLKWGQNPDTAWDAHAMAVHAAMVDIMDQGIGRIIQALRSTGKLDNTLILFLSDNGASPEICANFGPGFDRPGETRDGRKIVYATKKQVPAGLETTYSSIGPRWANVANTPWRFWKAESFEGGIHAPLIAFWPDGITVPKGSFTSQMGHVMDFMPTLVHLAHASYPTEFKGHAITPMEGTDLSGVFKGSEINGHTALYNDHAGGRYVRYGGWKLVSPDRDTVWRLYHIADDETELDDLSGKYPARVHTMDSMWHQWAVRVHVFPRPHK